MIIDFTKKEMEVLSSCMKKALTDARGNRALGIGSEETLRVLTDVVGKIAVPASAERKASEKGRIWNVGIGNSAASGVRMQKVFGTNRQVRKYIADRVEEDRSADETSFLKGTTSPEAVEELSDGSLYGWASFDGYCIEYSAAPDDGKCALL